MSKKNTLAKSAAMISIMTLISKFLGFLREIQIANRFGSGMETDTYFVAMTATVIIVGTLGSAVNTTIIPIFAEIEEKHGKKGKLQYLNNIINLVLIITLSIMVIGFFASPLIIKILAKGFKGDQFDLAVKLNRIGLPIVVLLGLTHVLGGLLNSSKIFGPPAIAGIPYNIIFLTYLLLFAKKGQIEMLMVVTVVGTLMQFLTHVPAVRHMGYRFSFKLNIRDPYLIKALGLTLPVLLGSAVQQINVVIDKTLASELAPGSVSALNYSSKINDMVIAVFIMAITTVIFPMLSGAFAKDDTRQMKEILSQGVNIILLITVPATIGLILLAKPLVYIFFEKNAFDPRATLMTSNALIFYSVGLVGASLRLMLNRVYYSLQDTITPMKNGAIAVVINVVLNLILVKYMAHSGLALATSISATVTTILLFLGLRKKIGPVGLKNYLRCFIKALIASLVMGLVVYLTYYKLGSFLPDKKLIKLINMMLSIGLGIITYFVMCLLLKIEELGLIISKLIRR